MDYRIQLTEFEGPLDLLLYFIRRDEIDVFDIPIAHVTQEFLQYVQALKLVNLDVAGEFVYMAALLISIKTKMLLPRQEVDEEGEPLDPRRELVERLLAYIRFKEGAVHLETAYEARKDQFVRGMAGMVQEYVEPTEAVEYRVSVFGLISALQRVLRQVQEAPPIHAIAAEAHSIEGQEAFLVEKMQRSRRLSFVDTCVGKSKSFIITTFLAILEMARKRMIWIIERTTEADFFIEPFQEGLHVALGLEPDVADATSKKQKKQFDKTGVILSDSEG
ncbi:MAG TPA: segregation/condensation protein A [Bacteroidetes bacterium]|nr:segregation/condensation protein A [Bacteroidota bacterium]